jgi:CRP-like cAMP-binding protein
MKYKRYDMNKEMAVVGTAIKKLALLPDEEINALYQLATKEVYKKDEFISKPDNKPPHIYFIIKGLFRTYFIDINGKEHTELFTGEGMFMSSYDAVFLNVLGYAYKQALEDSIVYKVERDAFIGLLDRHIEWRVLLQKATESDVLRLRKRQADFLMLDSKTRYLNFIKAYPQFKNRIQQRHIASYLGITPETLCRICAELD